MNISVENKLTAMIRPLAAAEDNGRFEDLAFLKDLLKDVRIVGMGESSHGTREHFQFKHRLLRYMVENCGVRTFMIESALDACDVVNEYVLYGRGNRAEALAGLHFWTWDTEEVSAMIDWMRDHNLHCQAGEEVSFLGFDCQTCDVALNRLRAKLLPVCEEFTDRVRNVLDMTEKFEMMNEKQELPETGWLLGWVEGEKRRLIKALGAESYQYVVRYARHLFQYTTLYSEDDMELCSMRDKWMAENVNIQLNALPEGGKIALWAHNAHMCGNYSLWKTMGGWLKDQHGAQYYIIGFSFWEGTFQSRIIYHSEGTDLASLKTGGLVEFPIPECIDGEWDYDFHQIGKGNYFLDLRQAFRDPEILQWGDEEKFHREIGAAFHEIPQPEFYQVKGNLVSWFDGVLHTEKSERSRPTPTGMRK